MNNCTGARGRGRGRGMGSGVPQTPNTLPSTSGRGRLMQPTLPIVHPPGSLPHKWMQERAARVRQVWENQQAYYRERDEVLRKARLIEAGRALLRRLDRASSRPSIKRFIG